MKLTVGAAVVAALAGASGASTVSPPLSARIIAAEVTPCVGEPCLVVSATVEVTNGTDSVVCIPAIYDSDGIALKRGANLVLLNNPGAVFSRYYQEASARYADGSQLIVQPRSVRRFHLAITSAAEVSRDDRYDGVLVRLLSRECLQDRGQSAEYSIVDLEHALH